MLRVDKITRNCVRAYITRNRLKVKNIVNQRGSSSGKRLQVHCLNGLASN